MFVLFQKRKKNRHYAVHCILCKLGDFAVISIFIRVELNIAHIYLLYYLIIVLSKIFSYFFLLFLCYCGLIKNALTTLKKGGGQGMRCDKNKY